MSVKINFLKLYFILWHTDPLLGGDSVNSDRVWITAWQTHSPSNEYPCNNSYC
jgi:hypothetical protein